MEVVVGAGGGGGGGGTADEVGGDGGGGGGGEEEEVEAGEEIEADAVLGAKVVVTSGCSWVIEGGGMVTSGPGVPEQVVVTVTVSTTTSTSVSQTIARLCIGAAMAREA